MRIIKWMLLFAVSLLSFGKAFSQVSTYTIDLSSKPDSVWSLSLGNRTGTYCGHTDAFRLTVILSANSGGISFDNSGAPSMKWELNCDGTQHSMKDTVCISGGGTHNIVFWKPGSNPYQFFVTSIPKPTFPKDQDTVRVGCNLNLVTLGAKSGTVHWNSIFPGARKAYNYLIDSIPSTSTPSIDPSLWTGALPATFKFEVSATPLESKCVLQQTAYSTVTVTFYPTLTGSVTPNPASFCSGGAGVSLTAAGIGGDGNYSYKWYNASNVLVGTGATYFATSQQNYTVRIDDGISKSSTSTNTCSEYAITVPVTVGSAPIVNAGADQYVCPTNAKVFLGGSVTYATGGLWTTSGTGTFVPSNSFLNATYTPSAAEIAAGTTTLTLTSTGAGGGCSNASDKVVITYPPALDINFSNAPPILCNGGKTNISTTISPVGGFQPYTYTWNTGVTTNSISNVGAGTYQLTVKDAAGCAYTENNTINSVLAISLGVSTTIVSVDGACDGTASVSASGGTGAYTYLWSPTSQNTQVATGLCYGAYVVTVTDANGCTNTSSGVINTPRCNGFQAVISPSNIDCYGDNDGSLTPVVLDPTPHAYTYSWNTVPAQTTLTATGLTANAYVVNVTDPVDNCLTVATGVVTEPTQLTNAMSFSDVTVVGGSTGSATANVSGGTPSYTYLWSNGKTTSSITGLTAGTYSVTIRDARNCMISDIVTISEPPCNGLVIGVSTSNVSCFGGNSGAASVYVIQYNAPTYSVSWSNGSTNPSFISNLVAGNYSVMVTDGVNCVKSVNFTIAQPSNLSMGLAPTQIRCNGSNDGAIDATVTGGTYPYTYSWLPGPPAEDIFSLGPNTYTLTVTDQNGCSVQSSAVIAEPVALTASTSVTNANCYGDSNGSIDLTAAGGTPAYTYVWSTGATTQDISNLTAGSYAVTVKDANGCTRTPPASAALVSVVSQPDSLIMSSVSVACPSPGTTTASVVFTPSGGTSPYQISYDNGTIYQTAGTYSFNLTIGTTYSVKVKDAHGCIIPIIYTLTLNPAVTLTGTSFNHCLYAPTTTVAVTFTPAGGNSGPYQISTNNGSSYNTAGTYTLNLAIGSTYSVIVKDGSGCISTTYTLTIPSAFSSSASIASNYNGQYVSCFGASNGSVDLTVSGGTTAYTYAWSNSQTTQDLSGIAAGTYSVLITDANGCTSAASVTLNQPAVLTTSISAQTNVACNGGATGSATVAPAGGNASYTYSWNTVPAQTTATATGLSTGTYSITVSDNNGCSSTSTVLITQPTNSISVTTSQVNVACNGSNTGSATAMVTGGSGTFSYSWTNGQTTATATGLTATPGTYTVTVTDNNGCTVSQSASVLITQPTNSISVTTSQVNVACNGGNTGSATAIVTGGSGSFAYSWTNGQTVATATGLSATPGTYTVTVTDNNGCTVSQKASVLITQPTNSISVTTSQVNVACNGGNTGSATAIVAGGSGSFSYSWTTVPAQTTATATGLSIGNYAVTVTDNNGCTVSQLATVLITQPTNSISVATSQVNVACNGGNTGSATAIVTGGSGTFSYSWTNGQTTATATGLSATPGNYTVTVTDNNGCTVSQSSAVLITQPTNSISVTTSQVNVACNGGNTGSATAIVAGGSGIFSYSWTNGQTTATATGLSATPGAYTVTVTDNNGCTVSQKASVLITQPTNSISITTSQVNVACNGGSTGSATAIVTGGSGTFSYVWTTTPTQTTATATGLSIGNYGVTVTDNNGCTVSQIANVLITQPTNSISVTTSQVNVACNGGNTGSATAIVTGGSGTFSYSWTNGQTAATATGLSATPGNYTVTVTDNNGCTVSQKASVLITQPTNSISVTTSQVNVACNGGNTGSATAIVAGGSGTFSYSWTTAPVQTTATATGLSATPGNYTVTVTDNNGCTVSQKASVLITQPTNSISVSTSQVNVACNGGNTGSATALVTGGSGTFSYSWTNGQTTATATGLSATPGNYTVTVTDNNGCTVSQKASVLITQPTNSISVTTSQVNVACNGGNTGSATAMVAGGSGTFSYSWTNGQTTATATGLSATPGAYTVTVTDNNGCTVSQSAAVLITQPTNSISVTSSQVNVACNGGNTGSATAIVAGGSGTFSYSWSTAPAQTTATATGLSATPGNYTVTVTDNNGCTVSQKASVLITQPTNSISVTTSQVNVACNGGNTGSATAIVIGGSGTFSYSWTTAPVQTTATATGLSATPGNYTVTVTDNNGCTVSQKASVLITQPTNSISVTTSQVNVACNGGNTGSATAIVTGGSGTFSYSWTTAPVQTTATATGLSATPGNYTVTVTDNNGCTVSQKASVLITQPTNSISVTTSQVNVACNGGNTGSATALVAGGSGTFSYSWTNGQTTATATGLSATPGNYTVTVTDNNGCTVSQSASVLITQPTNSISVTTSQVNVACNGGNTGSATALVAGGSGTFSYSWTTTPVQTTATATGLSATPGSYTVTVTDNNGCTVSQKASVLITQPTNSISVTTSQVNVFCNGGSTGSATATATGGSGTFTYIWSTTPQQSTATATGLNAANYMVTVTDNNGCTVSQTATVAITQPSVAMAANITGQTNVFCNGGATGSAIVTATGGSGSYSYSWNTSPVQTTNVATGLSNSTYIATVTDNNGCTLVATATAVITQPSTLTSTVVATTYAGSYNITCNGLSNGSINLTPAGGTTPYTYQWGGGSTATTQDIAGLIAGTYSVVVTDALGCSVTSSINLNQPAALTTTVAAATYAGGYNISCNGLTNGSVNLTVAGGTTAYSYLWSNLVTTEDISGLGSGPYSVTVTDANGCTSTKTVTLTQPPVLTATAVATTYAGGYNISCNGLSNGSINLTPSGGTTSYTYQWSGASTATTEDIAGLSAGTYSILVTDANACTTTNTFTLTQPVVLTSTVVAATYAGGYNISCSGLSNGSVNLTLSGGMTAYTYQWSGSSTATTEDITGLNAGTYAVLVTDANGCTTTNTVTLTQPVILTSTVVAATYAGGYNISCSGLSNGSINLTPAGGTTSYTYQWSGSSTATTEDITGLSAGTYAVLVTDANGCTTTNTFTLTQPVLLTTTLTPATYAGNYNISCNGLTNGSINLTPSGGTTAYTYQWSGASTATTEDITGLNAGTYSVLVTDANGCTAASSVALTEPAVLTSTVTPAVYNGGYNISCFGLSNGNVNLTVTGGTTAYTYSWNNSQTTEDISGLNANSYSVLITDMNGCTTTNAVMLTEPVVLTNTIAISSNYNGQNISCNGLSNGSIDLTVAGGTTVYTYVWTNTSQTTEDVTGLNANTYVVLVTDANGCTTTNTVTLTQPAPLTNTIVISSNFNGQNISCNGLSDGSIDLTVAGGTTTYTYVWTNSTQTTQDITGLSANVYAVVVTDVNGCTTTNTMTITEPAVLSNTVAISSNFNGQNISCFGLSNGAVDLSVSGGTTTYTYAWSNAATTQDISGIGANTYSVLITDVNGCTTTNTITVNQPALLTTSIAISSSYNGQNISCNGLSDGALDLTVNGGTTAYTYFWSTSATTEDISGLPANSYFVLVTDVNGCSSTSSVVITQPAVLSNTVAVSSNYNGQNISCNGLSDGSINLTVAGGTTAYTYAWSNAETTQDISGLGANTYSVLITDVNGCTTTNTITISEPAILSNTIAISTNFNNQNITCFGATNGAIDLTVGGGTTAYTYVWSNTTQTTQDITGLGAGVYSVLITDVNGCTTTNTVTLVQPTALTSSIAINSNYNGQPISCNGLSNGSIDLSVAGGTVNYTYQWSNTSQTTQDITGLSAGTYSVLVTDVNGCTATNSITVTQPNTLTSIITFSTYFNGNNISCNGASDGGIALTVLGGTAAYSYSWNTGATTQNLSGLGAGTYSVFVTDVNGCTTSNTMTLTQPTAMSNTIAVSSNYHGQQISCFGYSDGAIDLSVLGGTAAYSYSWSNGETTQDVTGLSANTYSVIITDANGCSLTNTITVTQPTQLTDTVTSAAVLCNGGSTGSALVTASGATPGYTYQWNNGQTLASATGLAAGTYTVLVSDVNGCSLTDTIVVTQPTKLVDSLITSNVLCNGGNSGSAQVIMTGGITPYLYSWSNGQTTTAVTGLTAGQYIITATDSNGCVLKDTSIITQPLPLANTASVSNVLCHGDSTGAAAVTIAGGTTPYSYLWSNNQTASSISGLLVGSYSVTVTDSNGCVLVIPVTITEPPSLVAAVNSTPASCSGKPDGTATANVIGGVSPYTYLWDATAANQTTQTATGLMSGIYHIIITDANGCTRSDSVTVSDISPIVLVFNSQNAACYGSANGTVDLTVAGGTQPYLYIWSNGATTEDLNGLATGTYVVTVLDSNQCSKSGMVIITEPDSISASYVTSQYPNGFNITLHGALDGFVDLTVSGGSSPYNIFWSTGDSTEDLNFVPAGDYYVQITDSNGCTVILHMTLTEPFELELPTGISPNGDGKNDILVVHGLESYPDNELWIYNRWGNVVYKQDDYMNDWKGLNSNGSELPEATYFVVLKIFGSQEITLTGYLDLRR